MPWAQQGVFDAGNRLDQVARQETYRYGGQVMCTSEARRNQSLAYLYLGNTQVATRGTVAKRNTNAPYGEAYGATNIDGTGYTGHVMDCAIGLIYMQQRYYDLVIGRFLSVDPVVTDAKTDGSFNRYWYGTAVKNNDMNTAKEAASGVEQVSGVGTLGIAKNLDRVSLALDIDSLATTELPSVSAMFEVASIAAAGALLLSQQPSDGVVILNGIMI